MLFEQTEARPDDIAGGTVSTGLNLIIDNVKEMITGDERGVSRHPRFLPQPRRVPV